MASDQWARLYIDAPCTLPVPPNASLASAQPAKRAQFHAQVYVRVLTAQQIQVRFVIGLSGDLRAEVWWKAAASMWPARQPALMLAHGRLFADRYSVAPTMWQLLHAQCKGHHQATQQAVCSPTPLGEGEGRTLRRFPLFRCPWDSRVASAVQVQTQRVSGGRGEEGGGSTFPPTLAWHHMLGTRRLAPCTTVALGSPTPVLLEACVWPWWSYRQPCEVFLPAPWREYPKAPPRAGGGTTPHVPSSMLNLMPTSEDPADRPVPGLPVVRKGGYHCDDG